MAEVRTPACGSGVHFAYQHLRSSTSTLTLGRSRQHCKHGRQQWRPATKASTATNAAPGAVAGRLGGATDATVQTDTIDQAHERLEQSARLTETLIVSKNSGLLRRAETAASAACAARLHYINPSPTSTFENSTTTTKHTSTDGATVLTTSLIFIAEEHTHRTDSTNRRQVSPVS